VHRRKDAKGPAALSLAPAASEFQNPERYKVMNRSILLILIGVLAVVAAGAGYMYYQERQSGIEIDIN
jgi:hypothetical protein